MDDQSKRDQTERTAADEADAAIRTRPSGGTRAFERDDAQSDHGADRMPTAEEEQTAEGLQLDPAVGESYKEQAERGARTKGEGRIS